MKRLSKRQVLLLHEQLLSQSGGLQGVRDEGLLESALAAPFQAFGDADAYPSLQQKAARLGYGLIKNPSLFGWKQAHRHPCYAGIFGSQWGGVILLAKRTFRHHFSDSRR